MTYEEARAIVLSFPGVEEGTSYGTPGFRVKKKFFTRLHQDGESLVLHVGSIDERDMLIARDARVFHITDHYRDYPSILVRAEKIDAAMLKKMLERRWRKVAPKTLIKQMDAAVAEKSARSAEKTPAPKRASAKKTTTRASKAR